MVDGHLHNAFDLVFDRVFSGEDFDILRVHLAQRGIKRRRFTGAGRSGDNEDSVRAADHRADTFHNVILHRESLEAQVDDILVEDSEYDGFAELRGQGRDTEVDLTSTDGRLDATILRQALFGDVEIRHDFQATRERGMQLLRWRHL